MDKMNKKQPKHAVAEEAIRQTISRFDVDDKIPGERIFARELGISYMTVRKAVENLVAQGVLYKIPKKGTYVADPGKATGKTRNICYFLDSSIRDGVSSPYYSLIFDALEKEARKNGFNILYFSDISETSVRDTLNSVEGAIISCFPRIEDVVQKLKELMPVVCIDNRSVDKSIPSVVIDNFNAVADAINYLCTLGHERIGFITGLEDSEVGRSRSAGYSSALKGNGIDEDTNLVFRGDYSFETGMKGADHLLSLDRQPTAIMCANDAMAIGAIKIISKHGLSVPNDISVIGFDDIILSSRITPALTTVAAPVTEIAQQSVDMLVAMINGSSVDNRHVILPGELVIRETCASMGTQFDRYSYSGDALGN